VAAPTFVAEYEASSWSTTTTPKTVTPTTSAGDVLAVLAATEDASNTTQTPSGNSLTFTQQQLFTTADFCELRVDTATDAAGGTGWTLTDSLVGGGQWGFTALRFSGSDGIGASAQGSAASGAPSLAITTTQDNSALVVIVGDWNAADGASRTWRTVNGITPTSGNGGERVYARSVGAYTVYAAYYSDAGAAGSKTVGLSAPSGQKYSIAAIEVKGVAAPPTVVTATEVPQWRRDGWLRPVGRPTEPAAPPQVDVEPATGAPQWRRDPWTRQQTQLTDQSTETPTTIPILTLPPPWRGQRPWARGHARFVDQPAAAPAVIPGPGPGPQWRRDGWVRGQAQLVDQSTPPMTTVGTGQLLAWWGIDDAAHHLAQRTSYTVPAGPPPADLDPTASGLPDWYLTWRRDLWARLPAIFADQSSPPGQLDPTMAAYLPLRTASTWPGDRRLIPRQQPLISDPSTYPAAPVLDPLTVAYGVGGLIWQALNRAATHDDRRAVPAQKDLRSDPSLLTRALLESPFSDAAGALAGRRAWYTDRRLVPGQRTYREVPLGPADPLLVAGAVGGALWQRRNTAATHRGRWVLRQWWQQLLYAGSPVVPTTRGAMYGAPGSVGSIVEALLGSAAVWGVPDWGDFVWGDGAIVPVMRDDGVGVASMTDGG
jgi:hypothetical protein